MRSLFAPVTCAKEMLPVQNVPFIFFYLKSAEYIQLYVIVKVANIRLKCDYSRCYFINTFFFFCTVSEIRLNKVYKTFYFVPIYTFSGNKCIRQNHFYKCIYLRTLRILLVIRTQSLYVYWKTCFSTPVVAVWNAQKWGAMLEKKHTKKKLCRSLRKRYNR